jgi:hypothetical protein
MIDDRYHNNVDNYDGDFTQLTPYIQSTVVLFLFLFLITGMHEWMDGWFEELNMCKFALVHLLPMYTSLEVHDDSNYLIINNRIPCIYVFDVS